MKHKMIPIETHPQHPYIFKLCSRTPFLLVLLLPLFLTTFPACNRGDYDESVKLVFSSDTIYFDTVFTTVGSITRNFTVYNPSTDPVKLDIYLAGMDQSYYSINVNGQAGLEFHDVEIAAHDSIFVFVKVNINPTNQDLPYLVNDSILFCNTSRQQTVQLVAYGQDAHFILPDHTNSSMSYNIVAGAHEEVHWTNDKPWVIYGWAVVDSLGKLIIDPGTRVYVHNGGGIWVYRYGNIQVNGTAENPVLFRGDRLESFYDSDYAQWDRIWINEGNEDNIFNYAIITNASIGLQTSALEEYLGNKTILNHSIIQNNYYYGVLGMAADLEMNNCQVSNNGSCSILLQIGDYNLNHVTAANYYVGTPARSNETMIVRNYYQSTELNANGEYEYVTLIGNTNLTCNNCIFYGNLTDREFAAHKTSGADLNYTLRNCLVKMDTINSNFVNCLFQDPQFVSNYDQDYSLQESSPAIDAGWDGVGLTTDLLGRLRNGLPDIGAYEYYPSSNALRYKKLR